MSERRGLAPGEPVDISYDRDDPDTVVTWASPMHRVIEAVAVRVADEVG